MSTEQTVPKLGKPGAGLPWPQSWIMKLLVPRMANRMSWEQCSKQFDSAASRILEIVTPLDAPSMQKKVLVPRLRGLEDSSRYWSVAMTLEHLVITSAGMANIVVDLTNGRKPALVVDTAKVKPQETFDAEAAKSEFRKMAEATSQKLKTETQDRQSKLTHPHPWFGPFSAHQWHWLVGGHLHIHKAQIREILKRL